MLCGRVYRTVFLQNKPRSQIHVYPQSTGIICCSVNQKHLHHSRPGIMSNITNPESQCLFHSSEDHPSLGLLRVWRHPPHHTHRRKEPIRRQCLEPSCCIHKLCNHSRLGSALTTYRWRSLTYCPVNSPFNVKFMLPHWQFLPGKGELKPQRLFRWCGRFRKREREREKKLLMCFLLDGAKNTIQQAFKSL